MCHLYFDASWRFGETGRFCHMKTSLVLMIVCKCVTEIFDEVIQNKAKKVNSKFHLNLILEKTFHTHSNQVPCGWKSSLQALPFFNLIMSISTEAHRSSTQVSFHVLTTTKWKVIIQANIWFYWYCILANPSVQFACHQIWRGHPPLRDQWRQAKTSYIR